MEKPDIVYLDLETQHSLSEVGGWRNINKLRVSIGVTFSTALNKYIIYWEPTVHQLIHQLTKAHLIVGFNLLKFDYKVLQAYTSIHLAQLPTLDIMDYISQRLYRPVSLLYRQSHPRTRKYRRRTPSRPMVQTKQTRPNS